MTGTQAPITAVTIAQDALRLLDAKRIVAHAGTYLFAEDGSNESLQEYLRSGKTPCDVCALGAVFCGLIDRVNEFDIDGEGEVADDDMRNRLAPYLDALHLRMIEASFESWQMIPDRGVSPEVIDACLTYRNRHGLVKFRYDDEPTLRLILRNIIGGGGVFDPAREGA